MTIPLMPEIKASKEDFQSVKQTAHFMESFGLVDGGTESVLLLKQMLVCPPQPEAAFQLCGTYNVWSKKFEQMPPGQAKVQMSYELMILWIIIQRTGRKGGSK